MGVCMIPGAMALLLLQAKGWINSILCRFIFVQGLKQQRCLFYRPSMLAGNFFNFNVYPSLSASLVSSTASFFLINPQPCTPKQLSLAPSHTQWYSQSLSHSPPESPSLPPAHPPQAAGSRSDYHLLRSSPSNSRTQAPRRRCRGRAGFWHC
jgi:hypothetical protein